MDTSVSSATTTWTIDKGHSQIGFSVKYLLFSTVRGNFKEFDATIQTNGEDFRTAKIDFSINPGSIDTGGQDRDAHLKNADFFDIEKFPEIKFMSDMFMKTDTEGNYELYGDLTVKGVTKQVKLNVQSGGIIKDPWGTDKALFSITGKINRKDWGLNWNTVLETGGVLVSDEVGINGEILLIRQS